jgi:hypothetical protein
MYQHTDITIKHSLSQVSQIVSMIVKQLNKIISQYFASMNLFKFRLNLLPVLSFLIFCGILDHIAGALCEDDTVFHWTFLAKKYRLHYSCKKLSSKNLNVSHVGLVISSQADTTMGVMQVLNYRQCDCLI